MNNHSGDSSDKSLEERIEEYQRDLQAYDERENSRWEDFHSCDASDLQAGSHQYHESSDNDPRPDPRDYGIEESE
jgi:hypothetical protein